MNYRRTFNCEDCGEQVTRLRGTGEALVCAACGNQRAADWLDYQQAMAAKFRRGGGGPKALPALESTQ